MSRQTGISQRACSWDRRTSSAVGSALYALVKIAFAAVWNRSAEYISFRPTSVAVMAPTLQIPDAYLVRSRGATGGHGIAGVDAMPGCDANASDALCKQFLKKTSRS